MLEYNLKNLARKLAMLTKKAKLLKQTEEKRICLEKGFIEKRLAQWMRLPFFSGVYPFFQWSIPLFSVEYTPFSVEYTPFFLFFTKFTELFFQQEMDPLLQEEYCKERKQPVKKRTKEKLYLLSSFLASPPPFPPVAKFIVPYSWIKSTMA
jgi:hypothetical protein